MASKDMLDYLDQTQHPDDARTERARSANDMHDNRRRVADFVRQQEQNAREVYKEHGLEMLEVLAEELPAGWAYPKGTRLYLKPPGLKQIIQFSHVNPESAWDIRAKMDLMLQHSVTVQLPSGKQYGHFYLKEPDRVYLILMLRELTFPEGQYYNVSCECSQCAHKVEVPLVRKHMYFHEVHPDLLEFRKDDGSYIITDWEGDEWNIGLPTIGLQTQMNERWLGLPDEDRNDEVTREFYRMVPYVAHNMVIADASDINNMLEMFREMSSVNYLFLNDIIDKMRSGIAGVRWKCTKCGSAEETPVRFRHGIKELFTLPGGFRSYTGQPVPAAEAGQDTVD